MTVAAQRRTVRVHRLGRVSYAEGLRRQKEAARAVAGGDGESLLLLEHEPVFTLGRNASPADILMTAGRRRELGIDLCEADRGGKVTYHGPGQLVGYPILDLSPDRKDVKRYVSDLEEVVLRTLADFGINAGRSALKERVTSVWIGNDKIAAIGVHISHWVTTHGFALNVTDEPLENFRGIVPCGIGDGGVTTMERALGRVPGLREVADRLLPHFADVFDREIMAVS
jgi:lipoyl(octanoyl) transferase